MPRSAVPRVPPALIVVAVVRPVTVTGDELDVVPPLPSWPLATRPQHFGVPDVAGSAQACPLPASIASADAIPDTGTRTVVSVTPMPAPRRPSVFDPQHTGLSVVSALMSAQANSVPALTVVAPLSAVTTT